MELLRIDGLSADPLAASSAFHSEWLDRVQVAEGDLILVFAPADHTHRDWRLAAMQGLARARAPLRVNAVAGTNEAAIQSALVYLAAAPGLTGQYLPLDDAGAGSVLSPAA